MDIQFRDIEEIFVTKSSFEGRFQAAFAVSLPRIGAGEYLQIYKRHGFFRVVSINPEAAEPFIDAVVSFRSTTMNEHVESWTDPRSLKRRIGFAAGPEQRSAHVQQG